MSLIKKINDPNGKKYDDFSIGSLVLDTEPIPGSFNTITSDAVAKIAGDVADLDAIVPEGASGENKLATAADVAGVQEDVDTIEGKIPSDTSTTNKLVNESGLQDAIDNASESWSTGFTPKGESSVSDLNDLTTQSNGDSYIVTDSGTLTDGSLAVVAGDQVAWDATNSVWYKLPQYALKQYGTDEIHNLSQEATSFASGDFIAVSNPTDGTRKMSKDTLLELTAQNTLAGNVAPAFVPNSTTTVAGLPYVYNGALYVAKEAYQGPWDANKFMQINVSNYFTPVNETAKIETFTDSSEEGIFGDEIVAVDYLQAGFSGSNDKTIATIKNRVAVFDLNGIESVLLLINNYQFKYLKYAFSNSYNIGDSLYDCSVIYNDGSKVVDSDFFNITKPADYRYMLVWFYNEDLGDNDVEFVKNCFEVVSVYKRSFYKTFEDVSLKDTNYDKSILMDTSIYSTSGFVTASGWVSTDYIDLENVVRIKKIVAATFSTLYSYAFFDENKDFISGYASSPNNKYRTFYGVPIPENAKYVRIIGSSESGLSLESFEVEFVEKKDIEYELNTEVYKGGKELLSSPDIYGTSGFDTYEGWVSTDYIDLENVIAIKKVVAATFSTLYSYAFFDENKDFISGYASSPNNKYRTFSNVQIPSGARYARFIALNYSSLNIESFELELVRKKTLPQKFEEVKEYSDHYDDLNVMLQKVCCIGDSLTEGDYGSYPSGTMNVHPQNYPFYLGKITNAEVDNLGHCGYTAKHWWTLARNELLPDADYDCIYIFLGQNNGLDGDVDTTTAGGDYWNYPDTNLGAYCAIIEHCQYLYPNAHIFLINQPYNIKEPNWTQKCSMQIQKVANHYNLPVIDIMNGTPMNRDNGQIYRPVGFDPVNEPYGNQHFGKIGYYTLAKYICKLTAKFISDNKVLFGLY